MVPFFWNGKSSGFFFALSHETMSDFETHAFSGNAYGAVRTAMTFTMLWAIGSSWSTAIRAIAIELVPHETMNIVLAELSAASVTTFLAFAIIYVTRHTSVFFSDQNISNTTPRTSHRVHTLAPLPR